MRLLFVRRTRGLGDAVMMTAAVERVTEHFRRLTRDVESHVLIQRAYLPVWQTNPIVKFARAFRDNDGKSGYDRVFDLSTVCAEYEAMCERFNRPVDKNRPQIWTEACGVEWKRTAPRIHLALEETVAAWTWEMGHHLDRPIIGVGYASIESWRDYPHIDLLIELLAKRYGTVLVFHDKEIPTGFPSNVVGCIGLPLREMFQRVASCDAFVGPDTAHVHVSGALGIPTFGLFGPTDGRIRLSDYDALFGLPEAFRRCGRQPCWYQPCEGRWCLSTLKPKKIVESLEEWFEEMSIERVDRSIAEPLEQAPVCSVVLS